MKNSIRYALLLLPTFVCAQEPQKHAIDKALDICTEKDRR